MLMWSAVEPLFFQRDSEPEASIMKDIHITLGDKNTCQLAHPLLDRVVTTEGERFIITQG